MIVYLKCTTFIGEIQNITFFKQKWIDENKSFKIYDAKRHSTRQPHEIVIHSYKELIFEIPPEKKEKETTDGSVSADEIYQLRQKVNIGYFYAKNCNVFN